MRKRFFIALTMSLLMTLQATFAYTFPVLVKVNDTYVKADGIFVEDGIYYGPARQLANSLRAVTEWEESVRSAHFIRFGQRLIVKNDRILMYSDDKYIGVDLTVKALWRNGRIYLPIDYFVKFFGATVSYNERLHTFEIIDSSVNLTEDVHLIAKENSENALWLARIISLEARGNSLYKHLAVAGVVMNRVKSERFPNTVYDVIKSKGQFPPAYYKGFDDIVPNETAVTAAIHAVNGENVIEDCLYFNLKPFKWKPKKDFYKEIEGDYFYR